jgi:hypothetical protein
LPPPGDVSQKDVLSSATTLCSIRDEQIHAAVAIVVSRSSGVSASIARSSYGGKVDTTEPASLAEDQEVAEVGTHPLHRWRCSLHDEQIEIPVVLGVEPHSHLSLVQSGVERRLQTPACVLQDRQLGNAYDGKIGASVAVVVPPRRSVPCAAGHMGQRDSAIRASHVLVCDRRP